MTSFSPLSSLNNLTKGIFLSLLCTKQTIRLTFTYKFKIQNYVLTSRLTLVLKQKYSLFYIQHVSNKTNKKVTNLLDENRRVFVFSYGIWALIVYKKAILMHTPQNFLVSNSLLARDSVYVLST